MALVLSGSIDISGSMTATTILVSSPGAAGMVSSSAQITELAPLMAYTASLKGAAIVSSSQQIQNYNLFAATSSANTFYGSQRITGSLDVRGTAGDGIKLRHSNGTNIAEINELSGVQGAGLALKNSSGTQNILLNAGGDSYINGGNLGIGTSTPSQALHLSSSSAIYCRINSTGGGDVYLGSETNIGVLSVSNAMALDFRTNNTTRIYATSAGNVGIGTSSPNQLLCLRKTSAGAETVALALQNLGNTAGTAVSMTFAPHDSGDPSTPEPLAKIMAYRVANVNAPADLIFYTYNTPGGLAERMRVSYTGGIGAAGSSTNIYNPSDIRLKQNISTITYGLDKIKALNPVKYNWIDGFETLESDKPLLGFIAQEVLEIIPEVVESFGGNSITIGNTVIDNPLRVNEKFLIPVLTKAIQEQQAIIDGLIARIEALENN